MKTQSAEKHMSPNPTEAKFHDDLETIASELDLGVRSGKFSWADVQAKLKDKTIEVAKTADRVVHENAWTGVAIAAGVGFIFGLCLKRD